ncbi:MAG TPA: hypothetical protein VMT16_13760, partial [Thermoanaerobaculia bacterium]|nr:hypothetical protein [Thermoanaerobaculia bacterium]
MTTIDLRGTPAAAATAEPRRVPLAVAGRELGWILGYLAVVAQLVLVLAALFLFHVEEDQGLLALGPLLLGGFAVHALLPRRWRRPFFLALSLAGLFAIVGLATGAAVLAAGLLLLGVCHLPIAWWARMTLLAGVAALLAALRLGHLPAPAAAQLALPVIASMFMFRLLLFLYDLRHQRAPSSPWTRLGYFFLLPNFSFLVFPVVGFGAFRRTWYDGEELAIYQKGLGWMLRGASHLVLYRVVAYYLMPTREAVHDLASLLQFLVTSYCQLLRISGQFHL